jgi:hypothetical protein
MRVVSTCVAAAAALFLGAWPVVAGESPAAPGSKVYMIWPKDGQVIHGGKLWLRMGARGVGVAPAGVEKPNTGHHHVIVDAELPPFDEEIPADKNHLHFGAGQSEARIELPPGQHTLQLLMGDHNHKKITVTVP